VDSLCGGRCLELEGVCSLVTAESGWVWLGILRVRDFGDFAISVAVNNLFGNNTDISGQRRRLQTSAHPITHIDLVLSRYHFHG